MLSILFESHTSLFISGLLSIFSILSSIIRYLRTFPWSRTEVGCIMLVKGVPSGASELCRLMIFAITPGCCSVSSLY